jgi:hypothetical protein
MDTHFHGQAVVDEVLEMTNACLEDEKVKEAIVKYKLPGHLKVVADT